MAHRPTKPLDPISFLQAFIVQSIRTADGHGEDGSGADRYVERIGLATSHCLEVGARRNLGYGGPIVPDQYADIVITLKNRIGGNFSRASAGPGTVRVVNSRCPFGDCVREAPELCRMTASVFGGIAARNFGYGKVELRKRIALGHDRCEVCIHIDPVAAEGMPGDEYRCEGDKIVSRSESMEVRARVEMRLRQTWCPAVPDPGGCRRPLPALVAESDAMRAALRVVETVAPTPATVLVTGETGVGKEVVARAIHAMSDRPDRVFLAINCGAIPDALVESSLFGHERGAFTGAYNVHSGFFERADHGTLLLDEIDSLPLSAQAKLLRVLQEGEFERVGGRRTLRTDARIVAASNQDLEVAVREGRFRSDLYYRLKVVPIRIPPLRERIDDLAPLVRHFLARLAEKYGTGAKALAEPAWRQIRAYSWPGNLRELENVLERAFLFTRGGTIESMEIPAADSTAVPESPTTLRSLRDGAAREVESRAIADALRRCDGNVQAVARLMGITPRAVHLRLKRLGIAASAFRRQSG